MPPTLKGRTADSRCGCSTNIFKPLLTRAPPLILNFRLNTNVELCQSLKQLLDNADLLSHLDADTRSAGCLTLDIFTFSFRNDGFFFPSAASETLSSCIFGVAQCDLLLLLHACTVIHLLCYLDGWPSCSCSTLKSVEFTWTTNW